MTAGIAAGALALGGLLSAPAMAAVDNDTCPNALDLNANGQKFLGSTQLAQHDNAQPLSEGPDAYFKASVANGQEVVVSIQTWWRPSLAVATSCTGNDIGAPVMTAFGGSTISWTNNSGSDQTAYIMLAGNHAPDFGKYNIQASYGPVDEVGVAAEAAAQHYLPRRTSWTFVEGTTRHGFTEFITLLSENSQTVTIQYMDERGRQPDQTCNLAALTRQTIRVNAEPGPSPSGFCRDGYYGDGENHDVSVRIVGTDEFRAERVMYHHAGVVDGSSNASTASTGDHD